MNKDKKLKTDEVKYAYLQNLTSSKLEEMVKYILDCQDRHLPTYEEIRVLWFESFKMGEAVKPYTIKEYIANRNNNIYHVINGLKDTGINIKPASIIVNRIMKGELTPRAIIEIFYNETNRRKEERKLNEQIKN